MLAAVCRHSKPKKPLPQLAFLVWWHGYTVQWQGNWFPDLPLVASVISSALDNWEQFTRHWVHLDAVPTAEWEKLDRSLEARLPIPLKAVQDRVGKAPFRAIVATLLNVAAGGFDRFQPFGLADEDDVHGDTRAALGTDQASWISRGLTEVLPELSASLNPARLRDVLEAASPSDLERARDEAQGLVGIVDTVSQLARLGMREGGPFEHLDRSALSTGNLAMLLLWWLSGRDSPRVRSMQRELLPLARSLGGLRMQRDMTR